MTNSVTASIRPNPVKTKLWAMRRDSLDDALVPEPDRLAAGSRAQQQAAAIVDGSVFDFLDLLVARALKLAWRVRSVLRLGLRSLDRLKGSRTEVVSPYEKRRTPRPLNSPTKRPTGVLKTLLGFALAFAGELIR